MMIAVSSLIGQVALIRGLSTQGMELVGQSTVVGVVRLVMAESDCVTGYGIARP